MISKKCRCALHLRDALHIGSSQAYIFLKTRTAYPHGALTHFPLRFTCNAVLYSEAQK